MNPSNLHDWMLLFVGFVAGFSTLAVLVALTLEKTERRQNTEEIMTRIKASKQTLRW